MQTELRRHFDLIERQRVTLSGSIRALGDTPLNWTPKPDVWSIRQIIEHLVLSDETLGRASDTEAVAAEPVLFRLMPRAWRRALILRALSRDVVLPLPTPAVEPRGDVSLPELLSRWEMARAEMGFALDTMRPEETRYSHPILGPLTALQMLELSQVHTAYHTRQIEARQRAIASQPQSIPGAS